VNAQTVITPKRIRMSNGRDVDLLQLVPEDIDIGAIAHSLAMQCRWGGHVKRHYSVAQHCVHVAERMLLVTGDSERAIRALLHDASEAFLGDIPRPIKYLTPMESFLALDESIQRQIYKHFHCAVEEDALLNTIDNELLVLEARQLMPQPFDLDARFPEPSFSCPLHPIPTSTARRLFLEFFASPSIKLSEYV
jgi:hypothetical protein